MTEMVLTLRLCSPLALHRSRAAAQYVDTLDYIPGSALRGALAEAYLARRGQPDSAFGVLFLSGRAHYGDLWPVADGRPAVLLPSTARACKRFGLEHPESFHDSLLLALAPAGGDRKCPHPQCGEPADRVGGYVCDLAGRNQVRAPARLRVSTAIERSTGTAAREMLFTQYALVDGQCFQGRVRLTDPSVQEELERLLASGTRLFLGAARSRGLGEVEIVEWRPGMPDGSLAERWREFNAAAWRAGGDPGSHYFSLTLLSHLALRDHLLRPVLDGLGPRELGLSDGVELVRYPSGRPVVFLQAVVVPGWNAALGLPKADTVALGRGSVLLFQSPAAREAEVLRRLASLETEGVGERREEGFGRVVACHPIHYEWWGMNE